MTARVVILGASGMLGFTLLRRLAGRPELEVHATLRDDAPSLPLAAAGAARLHPNVDANEPGRIEGLIETLRPQEVVNCIGLVKQLEAARDPAAAIHINALLPHLVATACTKVGARLIHFSTDCVFDGGSGNYDEDARADADDLYGRSKRLGEIDGGRHLTLRTSLIGHELRRGVGLVDWFLARQGRVAGYRKAIFSGFPTVEIARILTERILPDASLRGLFHLASAPISKFDLLCEIARVYGCRTELHPVDAPVIDRSLDGRRLAGILGYRAPDWPELVAAMHADFLESYAPLRAREAILS